MSTNITRKVNVLFSNDIPVNFDPIVIGRFCSAYGVLGWLKIVSFTENVDQIMGYCPWFVRLFSSWYKIQLKSWKRHSDNSRFIVKIENVSDRDIAKIFNNHEIYIDVLQLPPLNSGEYYWKNLIGCQVVGVVGYKFGVVIDLIETGANDVLVIRADKLYMSVQVILIPFLTTVVKHIDFLNRVIYVEWDINF